MGNRIAAIAACASAAVATPAGGQSLQAVDTWSKTIGHPAYNCPLSSSSEYVVPFFAFNGLTRGSIFYHFQCQQVGPITLNGNQWWLQNIKAITPYPACATTNWFLRTCLQDTVRLCSPLYVRGPNDPIAANLPQTGPFGGAVGPKGCEKLWAEEYATF